MGHTTPLTRGFFTCVHQIFIMSRNRAIRRANTARAAARRRRLVDNNLICGNTVTPNGESCSCGLCITGRNYDRDFNAMKLADFIATDY